MAGKRIHNPFKPTAGKTPPRLIGRDEVIRDFEEGLDNGPGAPGRLLRITGMRGFGKTVVLNELASVARENGWTVVDESSLPGMVDRVIASLAPRKAIDLAVKPSISVGPLSFAGEAQIMRAASMELRDAMNECLKKNGDTGVLILLDEVQSANMDEISHLATAIQHMIREDREVAFAFAGLPSAIDRFINEPSLTFLRRATPEHLGMLDAEEVRASMRQTIEASGMSIGESALQELVEASAGYPFMVQLVGYHAWQEAYRSAGYECTNIGRRHVQRGIELADDAFDRDVIEPALSSLSNVAIRYLLAMADDDGPSRTSMIASRMGKRPASLGKYREVLLRDGLIVAPRRGQVDYAMPYMRRYLRSHAESLNALCGD